MTTSKNDPLPTHSEPLAFLHLFKTAGTTLEAILLRQYPTREVMHLGSVKEFDQRLERFAQEPSFFREKIRIFMGHFNFKQRGKLPPDCRLITILRHPVDRVISEYYFILESPDNPHYEKVVGEEMSLADFVRSGLHNSLDNYQTKWLCRRHNLAFGEESDKVLDDAKQNLRDHFAAVGLTERFDESVILFKRAFGWKMPFYLRERVTRNRPKRDEIPPEDIALIETYNRMDLELYDFACDLFEEQLSAQDSSFEDEVRLFQLLNSNYAAVLSDDPPLDPTADVEFILVLYTLNKLLQERDFDAAQEVLAYGVKRYPQSRELASVQRMLAAQMEAIKRLDDLKKGVESGSVASQEGIGSTAERP